jgi:hypothetical protein
MVFPFSYLVKISVDKKNLAAIVILVVCFTMAGAFYAALSNGRFVDELSSSVFGITVFSILALSAYVSGLYLLSYFGEHVRKSTRIHDSMPWVLFQAVRTSFYVTGAIVAVIIFQLLFTSKYYQGLMIGGMVISYALTTVILTVLSYKFFIWYRSTHDIAVLLHCLTIAAAAIGFGMICGMDGGRLLLEKTHFTAISAISQPSILQAPSNNQPYSGLTVLQDRPSQDIIVAQSRSDFWFQLSYLPFRIGFFMYWLVAALLLRGYRNRLGRYKFLISIFLPLAFMIASVVFYGGNNTIEGIPFDSITPLMVVGIATFVASIYFILSRNLQGYHNKDIAGYLKMSGFGFILIVSASSPPVYVFGQEYALAPPFAFVSWSLQALCAWIFSFGFYFSATSISQDTKLRVYIRKLATKESKLFDNIGRANHENLIVSKVMRVAKDMDERLKENHILQSKELREEEMKSYIEEMIEELKKEKAKKNNNNVNQ